MYADKGLEFQHWIFFSWLAFLFSFATDIPSNLHVPAGHLGLSPKDTKLGKENQ